jgi:hypothetical protein
MLSECQIYLIIMHMIRRPKIDDPIRHVVIDAIVYHQTCTCIFIDVQEIVHTVHVYIYLWNSQEVEHLIPLGT